MIQIAIPILKPQNSKLGILIMLVFGAFMTWAGFVGNTKENERE